MDALKQMEKLLFFGHFDLEDDTLCKNISP